MSEFKPRPWISCPNCGLTVRADQLVEIDGKLMCQAYCEEAAEGKE